MFRQKYSKEIISNTLKQLQDGASVKQVNKSTGIPIGTIYRWRSEAKSSTEDPIARSNHELSARVEVLELKLKLADLEKQKRKIQELISDIEQWS